MHGWWYYYLVAIAVKVPITFWIFCQPCGIGLSEGVAPAINSTTDVTTLLPLVFLIYMGITAVGSSRNYGIRYLLPLAPLAIVWISAVAEQSRVSSPRVALMMRMSQFWSALRATWSRLREFIRTSSLTSMPWLEVRWAGGRSWRTQILTGARASSRLPGCSESGRSSRT